jgi:hypothetical protein
MTGAPQGAPISTDRRRVARAGSSTARAAIRFCTAPPIFRTIAQRHPRISRATSRASSAHRCARFVRNRLTVRLHMHLV